MKNLKDFAFQISEFDWDKWNVEKNFIKHGVTQNECEGVFLNKPSIEEIPKSDEQKEQRYYALGITNNGRKLAIVFTLRDNKIRVISARDMSRKERRGYGELEKGA